MPKVYIDTDELYPYYYVSDGYGTEVELTEAEIQYCKDFERAFRSYQDFLWEKERKDKVKVETLKRSGDYSRAVKDLLKDEMQAMQFKNEDKL